MPPFSELAEYGLEDFVINAVIFGIMTIPAFLLLYVFFKDKYKLRKIQLKPRPASITRTEIKYSVITLFVIVFLDVLTYIAQKDGYTKMYDNISDHGWLYFFATIPVLIVLHDTWFYFTHRAMHHPAIYKYVHKVHHLSTSPSPLAAFSFHPLEAVVQTAIYVIVVFIFPINFYALLIWQLFQMSMNVISHSGYEFYPKGFTKKSLFRFKTATTHHDQHHAKFNGNYSLYFTWWDRWLGTEFKDYHQAFDSIYERFDNPAKGEAKPVARVQEVEA